MKKYSNLLIFLLYLFLTLLLTYPLILKIKSEILGLPGDPFSNLWGFWWRKYTFVNNLDPQKVFFLNAPFGLDFSLSHSFSLIGSLGNFFSILANEVVAYNLLLILAFVFSAFFFYLFIFYLVKNRLASFLGGFIYAFSPYALSHSEQHLSLTFLGFIPLFLLFLFQWDKKPNFLNLFLSSLFFSLVVTENYYYGLFISIFLFLFFIYKIIKDKLSFLKRFFWFFFLALALTLLFNFKAFFPFLKKEVQNPIVATSQRPFNELSTYSAKAQDYFLPSPLNPFLGKISQKKALKNLGGSSLFEQTLYLGYLNLFFALFALYLYFSKRLKKQENSYLIPFFFISALFFLILSFSPSLKIFGLEIKTPSFYLYHTFGLSMFRVYARASLFVLIFTTILACFGFSYLFSQSKNKFLLAFLFFILIFFEFFQPASLSNVTKTSPLYNWLENEKGDFIVAEYPFFGSDQIRHSEYLKAQRFHQKNILNGALFGTKDDEKRKELLNIEDENTIKKLKELNVKYIIIHEDFYQEGRIPPFMKKYFSPSFDPYPLEFYQGKWTRFYDGKILIISQKKLGLVLVKNFDKEKVYEIIPEQ